VLYDLNCTEKVEKILKGDLMTKIKMLRLDLKALNQIATKLYGETIESYSKDEEKVKKTIRAIYKVGA
jgi:hypothetical protein